MNEAKKKRGRPEVKPERERELICRVQDGFHWFARRSASYLGSPWCFVLALVVIVAWAITGPLFGFSDTWQLIINTGTTIVTFLMVFLIQNTQNRDAKAVHLKLDELIRAMHGARNNLLDLEEMEEDEVERLEDEFRKLREHAAKVLEAKQHRHGDKTA